MVIFCVVVKTSEIMILRPAKYMKSGGISSLADSEKRTSMDASVVNRRDLQRKLICVNSHCIVLSKQHEQRGNLSFFVFSLYTMLCSRYVY
jgi:hypothetical protein